MEQEKIIKPASTWLGATLFSLMTSAAFGCGVFLMLFSGIWQGLLFIVIATAFAGLCWIAHPEAHKAQLWITGLTITLALVFLLYLIINLRPRFM